MALGSQLASRRLRLAAIVLLFPAGGCGRAPRRAGRGSRVLALNAMGVHLFDYLRFEELVPPCDASGRWEFRFVTARLRIVGGRGSPLNPLAIV